jgi:hypothetical protein
MNDRSYENAADEYDGLSFHQAVQRFSAAFEDISRGELMALGGKFLELAHGVQTELDEERRTSACLAEAIEEVILFRLAGNDEGIRSYLAAKQAHLEYLREYGSVEESAENAEPSTIASEREASSWLGSWFGKKG